MSKKSRAYMYDNEGNANTNLQVMLGYEGFGDIMKRRADVTLGVDFVNAVLELADATGLQPEYVIRIVLDDLITGFILSVRDGHYDDCE